MKDIIVGVGCILLAAHTLTISSPLISYNDHKASAATGPDLIVELITWSPESPSVDETVTISVTVKNQGQDRAINSQLAFRVDGAFRESQFVASLEAGDSTTNEFTWTARQGHHQIQMTADEDKLVAESDETNNQKSITISTLTPDLVVDTITWTPLNPVEDDNVTFNVWIVNQGDGKAITPLVGFHVDGERLDSKSLGSLDPGGTDNTTFNWPVEAGSFTFEMIVDPNDSILESDESNNNKIADFLSFSPDLVIQSITWEPEELSHGETVTFSVTITNQGQVLAPSSTFSFYVGGQDSGIERASTLPAGNSTVETFTWAARAGSNLVRVVLDTKNEVIESNETNNEMTATFSGTIVPDLVIQSLTWSPANPSVGEIMTFLVSIRNDGNGQAGSSQVSYYIDDVHLASDGVDPIATGSTQNTTFTWIVQEGWHSIKVTANANALIPESDDSNNEKSVTYPIPPDLVFKGITLSPEEPAEGDNVTFTVTAWNQGVNPAESTSIGYYINNEYLGFSTVKALNADATDISTLTWIATAGRHNLRAIIDNHSTIIEADENNNEILALFSVPVLSVTTTPPVTSEPTTPEPGEEQPSKPGPSGPGGWISSDIDTGGGESNSMLLYYLLGLGGIILIGVIFFEVWRRRD
ncbi:CARDB domain-containing protein [Chloroflexota bacterium]